MSREDLERLDDQGIAAWDNHKPDAFVEMLSDGFVVRDLGIPEPLRTKDEVRAYAQSWFTAFPDLHVVRTNIVVGDESVASEIEFTGTNTGPLVMGGMEIPATGKAVIGRGAYFVRVKDGKVVEFTNHTDAAGLMIQLGLMPQR
jgi:steroid delta-isomerase-like uncharacterized protein